MKCVVFPYFYDPPAKSWQLGALALPQGSNRSLAQSLLPLCKISAFEEGLAAKR